MTYLYDIPLPVEDVTPPAAYSRKEVCEHYAAKMRQKLATYKEENEIPEVIPGKSRVVTLELEGSVALRFIRKHAIKIEFPLPKGSKDKPYLQECIENEDEDGVRWGVTTLCVKVDYDLDRKKVINVHGLYGGTWH